jgi:hypothetical protein
VLCSLCAQELDPAADRCPGCDAPVGSVGPPALAPPGEPDGHPVPAGPPLAGPASADPAHTADWAGAVRAALLAALAAYALGGALATLVIPTNGGPLRLWVTAPCALVATALGGSWQVSGPALDAGLGGQAFGYQVRAFPLLLTGALGLALARAVRSRLETGRANDTLRQRGLQAVRVGVAVAGVGLVASLLSRDAGGTGAGSHAGYVATPVGGFVLATLVAGAVAVGYDPSQLPPRVRAGWAQLQAPLRASRSVLVLASVLGTLVLLVGLQTAPASGDPVTTGDGRRLLSGLAVAAAPNLGWWLLGGCLGMPVRLDLLTGDRADQMASVLVRSGWWWAAAPVAAGLLLSVGVRLVAGAPDPAAARRRVVLWCGVFAVLGVLLAVFGELRAGGRGEPWPVEYQLGGTGPRTVLLPPVWAALAGAASFGIARLLPPATRARLRHRDETRRWTVEP